MWNLSTAGEWFDRFSAQTEWSAGVRQYLFTQYPHLKHGNVLEVGCGPGAVIASLKEEQQIPILGLDIRRDFLEHARLAHPEIPFIQADAHRLPFASDAFDLCVCHYLLLWVQDPLQVLREMRRITRAHGVVAVLAEPDYSARVDQPAALKKAGDIQNQALAAQGANVSAGRQLAGWMHAAGFVNPEVGQITPPPAAQPTDYYLREWAMLERDLADADVLDQRISHDDINRLRVLNQQAAEDGTRHFHIPTYYALAIAGVK